MIPFRNYSKIIWPAAVVSFIFLIKTGIMKMIMAIALVLVRIGVYCRHFSPALQSLIELPTVRWYLIRISLCMERNILLPSIFQSNKANPDFHLNATLANGTYGFCFYLR